MRRDENVFRLWRERDDRALGLGTSDMSDQAVSKIVAALQIAIENVRASEADPRVGWAWMIDDYRTSLTRAFHGQGESLTLTDEGVQALTEAMNELVRDRQTRLRWKEEDLWTLVLSLLAAASGTAMVQLDQAVKRILNPVAVRTAAAIANVTWNDEPATFGDLVIGSVQNETEAEALARHVGLDTRERSAFVDHSLQLLNEYGAYVAVTATSHRQGERAYEDFERVVEDLIGLILLFSDRLEEFGVYSMRGATNRPGVRGISLDRVALGEQLREKGAGELGARILTIDGWSTGNRFRWQSADPMPLSQLLDANLRPHVCDLLFAKDAIAQRVRVAARWYARAFWADAEDDAALTVSVALDSLLTGKEALPGAVSKGRFALLERVATDRDSRLRRYDEVYKVRNAIAHGGDGSSSLAKIGGARSMLLDARWVAERLVELRRIRTPNSENELRDVWSAVQWGTVPWAHYPDHALNGVKGRLGDEDASASV